MPRGRANGGAKGTMGVVYLIHLDAPLVGTPGNGYCRKRGTWSPNPPEARKRQVAGHYLGWAKDLPDRIDEHVKSHASSSRLIMEANRRGIAWRVVRTWEGTRDLEKKLRGRKQNRQLCPECHAAHRAEARARTISHVACATT
jgi:hypothetical protein